VKTLNNTQDKPRILVTEQVVGRVGKILGGPTCDVRTIQIPQDLAGWEFRPGRPLTPGIAHASLAIDLVVETRNLSHREDDENAQRHVHILAIHDWCWADDAQWLIAEADRHRFYSHDHGWYLPPGGGNWTADTVVQMVDQPHELGDSGQGLDMGAVDVIVARLEAVTRDELVTCLAEIPQEWPVTDTELEAVGYFLERRAPQVAQRLRQRFGRLQ